MRVYLPVTPGGLREALAAPALVAGWSAYAVTEGLLAALGESDEEIGEYAALHLAGDRSWALRDPADPARRVVLVAEVGRVEPGDDEPGSVRVPEEIAWRRVQAMQADTEPLTVDPAAAQAPELGWFATQEIAEALAGW